MTKLEPKELPIANVVEGFSGFLKKRLIIRLRLWDKVHVLVSTPLRLLSLNFCVLQKSSPPPSSPRSYSVRKKTEREGGVWAAAAEGIDSTWHYENCV